MSTVQFYKKEHQVPLEMHKVRVVQKLTLLPVEERLRAIQEAGNNTFCFSGIGSNNQSLWGIKYLKGHEEEGK